ncbi:MAG: MFS transporter [Pseudomonadota bacterium]
MAKENTFHWAWIVLATCFVNLFINYSVRLGYSVVLPEMIRELGISRTQAGSIFNAYLFCYIAVTPFTGYLTDRLGARRVIATCAFILGLGVILMGTVTSFWMGCLFYAIVGLGATGMWTPIITVVQRWFVPKRRGLALGLMSTGYGLGFATMGLVFPWIVNHFSWRHSWYFLGTGAIIMVLANALLLRSDPESAGFHPWGYQKGMIPGQPVKVPETHKPALLKILTDRSFLLIGLSYFSISCSLYGITTFMVDYAKYQIGLPLEKASLLATVHGSCQVVGVLTILPLSDYLGRKRTILISNSVIAATIFGILLSGNDWMALFVLVGIMAVFYGVTFPMYGACAGDYFPKEIMGTVLGAWTPFYGLGAIMAHWISGILRDMTGRYNEAFMFSVGVALTSLFLMLPIKKVERIH